MATYLDVMKGAVAAMKAKVGLCAIGGKHRGPEIDAWNTRVHAPLGSPWCASCVWCHVDDQCKALGLRNPIPPTAAAHGLLDKAPPECVIRIPVAFSIFVHLNDPTQTQGHGHCGFAFDQVDGTPGGDLTIEGDTNAAGSSVGDQIGCHMRRFGYADGYIYLPLLDGSGTIPEAPIS